MSLTRKVIKNAAFGVISQLVTWGLAWILLIALPRELGDEGFGRLFFAISFAMVASILLNLGINTWLTKEVARDPGSGEERLAEALGLKLALSAVVYALMLFVVRLMDVTPEAIAATDIVGAAFLIGSFGLTWAAWLQGSQLGGPPALALVFEKLVLTVASLAMLQLGYGLVAMAWVMLLAACVGTSFTAWVVYRSIPFRISWNRAAWKTVLVGAAPFLIWVVFGEIYVRIDVLMLTAMTSDDVVGWYGAAFRLYGTVLFIPNVFMTTVFPALSRKFAAPDEEAHVATRRTLTFMLAAAVPIGMGTTLIARPMVATLFGPTFVHATENLELFGLSMVLVCVNVVLGSVLIANDQQGRWAFAAVGAALLNPLMNLALIPWSQQAMGNGGWGAALATLLTEIFLMVVALRLLPAQTFDARSRMTAFKALAAGTAMLVAVHLFGSAELLPIFLVASVTYVLAALVLQVIPKDDLQHIAHAIRKRG